MAEKLPFNPKGNIFRWGPIPNRFFYPSIWVYINIWDFPKRYGARWSESLFLFKDKLGFFINDNDELNKAAQPVFKKFLLPKNTRLRIYRRWLKAVNQLSGFEVKITANALRRLTNLELYRWWRKFSDIYREFWIDGNLPELANYGSEFYLADLLSKTAILKSELPKILEILTAPDKLSFYQEEEIALSLAKDLKKHQEKFFWLKNSYAGTSIAPLKFFVKRKKELPANLEQIASKKIAEVKRRKLFVKREFGLSKEIMDAGEAIANGVGWQDERKKHIFIALHYQDLFLKEVARRFKYDFDALHDAWFYEIEDIIKGKDLRRVLAKRAKGFGVRFFKTCRELTGAETNRYWMIYGEESVKRGTLVASGIVASVGEKKIVRGRARILLDPQKSGHFKKGEILLAPMTSPEYVFAMKKAAAIVTDAGGLTSHAAIVSRELGVPCIVGTKIATKIFRDGQMVEVDANKGIVKIV